MRIFLSFLKLILTLFISLVALYVLGSNLNIGSYKSFVVQSGSMEPAIMTGDVVVVHRQDNYYVSDVVTFYGDGQKIITHRLIEINGGYLTKGDANRSFDEAKISRDQIIGKVVFIIPRLGYLMSFVRTTNGLIFLVLIPAAIFVIDELLKIMENGKQKR